MKKSILSVSFLGLIISMLFHSCLKDDCSLKRIYFRYDPVYQSIADIHAGLNLKSEHQLIHPGKIYIYGSFLLINEIKTGIHIFNNDNPSNPVKVNFINIPGNVDLAVRDGILYADSYVDLLAIDINDPYDPKLLCRTEGVFTPISIDPVKGLLVDYIRSEETITLDCHSQNFQVFRFQEGDIFFDANAGPNPNSKTGNFSGLSGIGGSMARFTVVQDHLYTVDISNLNSFNVGGRCPILLVKNTIGWNIETIYPYNDNLFIGSTSGMFIFSLADPSMPKLAGSMNHWSSCDPVIVQGDYAYVTLHGGAACGGFTNQLDIVDVKNIYNPKLLTTYNLEYPLGLGIIDDYLFICDNALKVYKLKSPVELSLAESFPHHNPYDVIVLPAKENLVLISEGGIYQYDISKRPKLSQLSVIPVHKQ